LANIRSKFKGDKTLDGYQKKKYVCKLLFIFLLGHDIDFGHMEAVNLLSSNKYSEKQIVSTPNNCFNNHVVIHRVKIIGLERVCFWLDTTILIFHVAYVYKMGV